MIIIYFFFIFINVLLAFKDANLIKQGIEISHEKNAVVYCGLIGISLFFVPSILLVFSLLLQRIVLFNTFLNYFRGLPLTYLSDTTTSVVDQYTNFIPKKIGYWTYHSILFSLSLIPLFL
jgi:hypothetical protein